jgi:hypothetical protein
MREYNKSIGLTWRFGGLAWQWTVDVSRRLGVAGEVTVSVHWEDAGVIQGRKRVWSSRVRMQQVLLVSYGASLDLPGNVQDESR